MKISGRMSARFFCQHERGAGSGRGGVTVFEKQSQREDGEQHGRHVQLRHHPLGVKERIEQQEQSRQHARRCDPS